VAVVLVEGSKATPRLFSAVTMPNLGLCSGRDFVTVVLILTKAAPELLVALQMQHEIQYFPERAFSLASLM